jgi:hypothetical protein
MESRITPIIGILVGHPVPIAHVAVNPQPLPPGALLQFDPLPDVNSIQLGPIGQPPGPNPNPIQVQGTLLEFVNPSGTGGGGAGLFTANYSLQETVNESLTLPGPGLGQSGALLATINFTGQWQGVIELPGQAIWSASATFAGQGMVSGPLHVPPAGTTAIDIMSFVTHMTMTETERPLSPLGGIMSKTVGWLSQTTLDSAGSFRVTAYPPGPPTYPPGPQNIPLAQQDQVSEILHPPGTSTSPVQIAAVYNTNGDEVLAAFLSGSPTAPLVVGGTTQCHDQLNETITFPPGPTNGGTTQTLNEGFDMLGDFFNMKLEPGL